jgi:diguanylate cyclase (GGDEF)-like protein
LDFGYRNYLKRGGSLQALIVDDDKDTARFFGTVLGLVGFEVEIVLTAREALAQLASLAPDLILLDMRLGYELGGGDILFQIRSNPRLDKTRVIVITAYPAMADPISNLADLVLLKPVEVEQLKQLAERLGNFDVSPRWAPFRDPVTELFNREFFITRLELAFERAKRRPEFLFAITVFHLKVIESTEEKFTTEASIHILQKIAQRFIHNLRPTDTIAYIGGWKFAVLNEDLKGPDDPAVINQRLREKLIEPIEFEGENFSLIGRLGVITFHPGYQNPNQILEEAEKAMESNGETL